MTTARRFILAMALVMAFDLATGAVRASASEFKLTKPIDIYVTTGAGGSSDVITRAMGEFAQKHLGQPFNVVNMPDAGGAIAMTMVKKAKPDGQTMVICPSGVITAIVVFRPGITYNIDDYDIATGLYDREMFFIIDSKSPYKTFEEWVEAMKKEGRLVTFGVTGMNNATHIAQLSLLNQAGLQAEPVPLASEAEIFANVSGGHIDAGYLHEGLATQYLREDLARPLCILSEKRSAVPELAVLRSTKELGFKDIDFYIRNSVFVPKGTPKEILDLLKDGFRGIMKEPKFIEFIKTNNLALINPAEPEEMYKWYKEQVVVLEEIKKKMQGK
ncbi:MAG: tripartite tricarboxylate transporter substrate binding protein [Planctomycetota bacterium]|jgi:tripartite-type tricarboxylate transporter receptor subunit TctC|nr:tripartite tricarboxylate transporter substrate binding protein [Planctomycetota bacterium]